MEITIDSAVQVWSYLHSILIYADVSREVFKVIKFITKSETYNRNSFHEANYPETYMGFGFLQLTVRLCVTILEPLRPE